MSNTEQIVKEINFDRMIAGISNISVIPESEYVHMHKGMPVFNVLLNESDTTIDFLKGTTIEQFEIAYDYINYAMTHEDGISEDNPQYAQEMRNALFQYVAVREWLSESIGIQTIPRKATFI